MWLLIAPALAFDFDNYRLSGAPWEAGGGLALVSPEVGEVGEWSGGIAGIYANEPAPGLIEGLGTVRMAGAWVPVRNLRLEFELASHAAVLTEHGQVGALGDAELRARVPVLHLGDHDHSFAIAVQPVLSLPTGRSDIGVGAGSLGGGLTVPVGAHLSPAFRADANVSVLATRPAVVEGRSMGTWFGYGAGVTWSVIDSVRLAAELTGRVDLVGVPTMEEMPVDAGFSVAWSKPEGGLGAALGVSVGIVEGPGAPAQRVVLALGYREGAPKRLHVVQGPADLDGDGLFDDEDVCINDAEDKDGTRDHDGCPDLDDDGDAVVDTEDLCRGIPGSARFHGCADGDGDAFGDAEDACPAVPGSVLGCPGTLGVTAQR